MSVAERVWWLLTFGAVAWYMTVTVVVAVRGVHDIRSMLQRLGEKIPAADEEKADRS
jgi:hypothetical protein